METLRRDIGYGQIFKSLGNKYAEKFVKEQPCTNIGERQKSFTDPALPGHTFMNSESFLGPWQTWPAQRESLCCSVSAQYSRKESSYNTLKRILLIEHPEILTRDYVRQEEYQATLAMNFGTILEGMYKGKLERVLNRKMDKIKKSSFIKKLLYRKEDIAAEAVHTRGIYGRVEFYYSDQERTDKF